LSKYTGIQKEETLKGLVHDDYFSKFGYEPNIDNIDFVVTDAKTRGELFTAEGSGSSVHYLWAEAKKGGDFYTPEVWVKKSQEYLQQVFSDNWQDEYYIWDCASGTGNLLVGITKKYNVWASTISQGDVALMNARIDTDKDIALLPGHVFQFDFLNDSFDKLPAELKKIIDDPEKQKKLIVYINPPYAEASSYGFAGKPQVANETKVFHTYKNMVGAESMSELFAQFFVRIYHLLPHAKLASFATPIFLTSTKFIKFRAFFKAECKAGFICRANTFDNVHGNFPISFLVWDFENKKDITEIKTDIISNDSKLKEIWNDGIKRFYPIPKQHSITDWRSAFYSSESKTSLGYIIIVGPAIQSNSNTFITSAPAKSYINKSMVANIAKENLADMSIYFAVRHCIEHTWINHNDLYLHPNENYKSDVDFQNNCIIFTLFHGKNFISSNGFTNYWIPFTPEQVDAKEKFESNFMSNFLKDRTLSAEAQSVYNTALALWKYYHAKTKNNKTVSVNASFYDIREYFQGRNDKGTMNSKSADKTYTQLLGALRDALKTLTQKIQPKVYEYGFLRE
jgi:hypothetical protein